MFLIFTYIMRVGKNNFWLTIGQVLDASHISHYFVFSFSWLKWFSSESILYSPLMGNITKESYLLPSNKSVLAVYWEYHCEIAIVCEHFVQHSTLLNRYAFLLLFYIFYLLLNSDLHALDNNTYYSTYSTHKMNNPAALARLIRNLILHHLDDIALKVSHIYENGCWVSSSKSLYTQSVFDWS